MDARCFLKKPDFAYAVWPRIHSILPGFKQWWCHKPEVSAEPEIRSFGRPFCFPLIRKFGFSPKFRKLGDLARTSG